MDAKRPGEGPSRKSERVLVGAIGAAVGLKGEVRLASFTEEPEAIADYGPLESEDGRRFEIAALRHQAKGLVARFKGIATREAAQRMQGLFLYVPRAGLPEPEQDDYYRTDLIGLEARLASGEVLGEVISVQNFGAGDLLEVKLAAENRTAFVPFTREIVPNVDLDAGRVVLDPPPGLLDAPDTEDREDGKEDAS